MVNSEMWFHTKANFAFCALVFCNSMFVMGHMHTWNHKCDPATGQCWVYWASSHIIWLALAFGLPLGVDWEWGSLAYISNKFWTKARQNFSVLCCATAEWQ